MQINTKKLLSTAIAILFCSTIWGDAGASPTTDDSRLSTLEQYNNSMNQVKAELTADNVFFVDGEYLLWHAYEDGLAYAVEINSTTDRGDVQDLDFDWDSGFRAGLGYRMPHDKWELDANWTRFYTSASGSTSTSTQLLYPEWDVLAFPSYQSGSPITIINGSWNLHLNVLDGEISHYFMTTPSLSFKPHMGIRGIWIKQTYHTQITGGIVPQTILFNDIFTVNSFARGAGFRAGLDTQWEFCKHWSLFGNIGGSLLFTTFNIEEKDYRSTAHNPPLTLIFDIKDQIQQLVPTVDLAMGISWDYSFSDMVALCLQLGWEFNDFFGQNKFRHFFLNDNSSYSFVGSQEDLTMQGLVVSARLDF
ncbi:MAG: hypothetical protein HY860_00640 [Chlamydiales bacterium]|nr:hypothetical protein [Chlamydiales bacterium]